MQKQPSESFYSTITAQVEPAQRAVMAQMEVEDLIASSSEGDALSRLQDFIADYVPYLRDSVMELRTSHELIRSNARQGRNDPTAVNIIRNEILELLYEAIDGAMGISNEETAEVSALQIVEADGSTDAPPAMRRASSVPPKKKKKKKRPPSPGGLKTNVVCRLEGVSRSYSSGQFRMDPVTMDIHQGEIVAIAGRNASGKTTLLRMMMGDLLPTKGKISYPTLEGNRAGKRKNWLSLKRQIASVPQLPEKWHGRLRHNLQYVASVYGSKDQDLQKFVEWHLARYELYRFRNSNWDEISGGYKIRFELVRALLTQPKFLILDEPLAYLDAVARDRFLRDIRSIADSREHPMPIVITSQHLSEIEAIADTIILLDDGALKYSGSVENLAEGRTFQMLEIAVRAPQSAVETALSGTRLEGIEATVEGYILAIPKDESASDIFVRLSAAFGSDFTMMRDITGSVRAIMSDLGT